MGRRQAADSDLLAYYGSPERVAALSAVCPTLAELCGALTGVRMTAVLWGAAARFRLVAPAVWTLTDDEEGSGETGRVIAMRRRSGCGPSGSTRGAATTLRRRQPSVTLPAKRCTGW